ncbi:SUKH-4 family immunity protein [Brevibacillus brevis]|uniref:SUKH-4 family immunity protein n=1 Tax=Brevibacillus sp. HB1.3 TaxID=2738842 RepID=UPI001554F5A1|nr:SUKH-4 family immunity protein [Brevibacillus sp. HB1.3]NQF15981.1 hypothetical protein [Brevibacillus sp. HB1.3]WGV61162.1 SUKH-4 family immunity protein [Brevibacillus brevis]
MEFDIHEILDYYDTELRDYNYFELIELGISHENADFMVSIGVPEKYDNFVFYDANDFQKTLIDGAQFIIIGHYADYKGRKLKDLYFKVGSDGFFTTSSLRAPLIYMLNKNLRTFFLFDLIKNEVATKMRKEGEFNSYKYAIELRGLFEQIDPEAMKDVEGFWSRLIEDYEIGL